MQEYLEAPVDTIFFVVKRSPDNTDNGNTDAFERKGQIVQPIYVQEYRWNPAAGVATKEGKRQRRELTFSPDGTPNPGFDVVRGACLRQEGDILEVPKLQAVV